MKIIQSSVHMQSQHRRLESRTEVQHLELWQDSPSSTDHELTLSPEARASQVKRYRLDVEIEASLSPHDAFRITLLKRLFEHLTGRPMDILTPAELEEKLNGIEVFELPQGKGNSRQGFGLVYDYYAERIEEEHLETQIAAQVVTSDGERIDIEISLRMSRRLVETYHEQLRLGDAVFQDPLVINFDAPAALFTPDSLAFDIDSDGRKEQIAVLAPGSGFLAVDKNKDGTVNNGSELFGPQSGNGFTELAAYDEDNNHFIDSGDSIFEKLRIWTRDAQGKEKLLALGSAGVGAIYLGHIDTPFELSSGDDIAAQLKNSSFFISEKTGANGTVQEVDIKV